MDERYRIIFGERRFRAAIAAEKTDIPAVIFENLSEAEAAILTALENLQREDLDLEDEALQFSYLLEVTGLSQRALADRLGKTHNYISRRVRLLHERPELFGVIRDGKLTQKEALERLAEGHEVYHGDTLHDDPGDTGDMVKLNEGIESAVDASDTSGRQVGVYHGDTLVSVISVDNPTAYSGRTPRNEMPLPRVGIPARWQSISRTYRVLGKIQPEEVPIEECEDLAHKLEDLEVLAASTRRALQARLAIRKSVEDTRGTRDLIDTDDRPVDA